MDFSRALKNFKLGKKLKRQGKDYTISLITSSSRKCFKMETADGRIIPYSMTTEDILAEDWFLAERIKIKISMVDKEIIEKILDLYNYRGNKRNTIEMFANGYLQIEIAKELQLSKQYVSYIVQNFVKRLRKYEENHEAES